MLIIISYNVNETGSRNVLWVLLVPSYDNQYSRVFSGPCSLRFSTDPLMLYNYNRVMSTRCWNGPALNTRFLNGPVVCTHFWTNPEMWQP